MVGRTSTLCCVEGHCVSHNGHMEAAFFDLDKTIVARSSPLALSRSFMKAGLVGPSFFAKSLVGQIIFLLVGADETKMEKVRKEAAKLTAGWEQEKVRQVVQDVFEEVLSPLIYSEALELLHDHRAAGRLLCIVSSSPEEIVEPLAHMLGVDEFVATKARVKEGRYTGELDFYAYGGAKAEAVRELAARTGINLAGSFAYSDSVTDLPLLESVGNPVVVNPDKALRRLAEERGWRTETFRNPVSLRDRLPQLRPPPVPRAAGVATAAGIALFGGFLWWSSRRSGTRKS